MCENAISMLSAISTLFAAIAAWFSFRVARNSLDFQKNYAKNQNLIIQLNRAIYMAETLQILIPKPLDMSDEDFDSIDPLLQNLKSELERLGRRNIVNYQELKISNIKNKFDLVREFNSLEEVIHKLEAANSKIFE